MVEKGEDLDSLTGQLRHPVSAKRRAAAKRLRRLGARAAGPALLAALRDEVRDERTWETQYQMISALGDLGYAEAAPFLEELASREFKHTMVLVALGDALLKLRGREGRDPRPLLEILATKNKPLIEGALRAVAMRRLRPDEEVIRKVIALASDPENEELRFWAAAAAPGWDGPEVEAFLRASLASPVEETRRAAAAALEKKYLKWNPL